MLVTGISSDGCAAYSRGLLPGSRSVFYAPHPIKRALDNGFGKGRIVQRRRQLFPVGIGPLQELDELLPLRMVFLLGVNQKPSRARDRISLWAGRIDHRKPEIGGNGGGGEGRRDRRDRRHDV